MQVRFVWIVGMDYYAILLLRSFYCYWSETHDGQSLYKILREIVWQKDRSHLPMFCSLLSTLHIGTNKQKCLNLMTLKQICENPDAT